MNTQSDLKTFVMDCLRMFAVYSAVAALTEFLK